MTRTEKLRILPWRVVRVILLEPQRGKSFLSGNMWLVPNFRIRGFLPSS